MRFKTLLTLFLYLWGSNLLFALSFEVGGINYTQCWSNRFYENAVYVAKHADGSSYQGNVTIPRTVSYEGEDYWIVGVGDEAFKDCTEMTSCEFEGTIEWIGNSAFEGCTGLSKFTIPSYYSDDVYQNYVYLGYRAFWGCHLTSLTCKSGNPPVFNYNNPSNYNSGSPTEPMWIGWDYNDYWHYQNSTTLYVPVGKIAAYSEKSEEGSYRTKWGDYFTIVKEWGVEEDDTVPALYDRLKELKPLCEEKYNKIVEASMGAYYYLLTMLYTISDEQGKDIEPMLQELEAAFERDAYYGWTEGQGYSWTEVKLIPELKSAVWSTFNQAEELLEQMQEDRIAYYKARQAGDDAKADNLKPELERAANEVATLINQVEMMLEALSDELIQAKADEFVENFKALITAVPSIKADASSAQKSWYTINGQRLSAEPAKRGLYIRAGKKVIVK